MRSHLLKFGLGVILFITVGLLFVFWSISAVPTKTIINTTSPTYLDVSKVSTAQSVMRELVEKGHIQPNIWYRWWLRSNPKLDRIKSGWYTLRSPMTLLDLFNDLYAGAVTEHSITLVEGKTTWQWLAQMAATQTISIDVTYDPQTYRYVTDDGEVLTEGYFAPETYRYSHLASASGILKQAAQRQQTQLQTLLAETPRSALLKDNHALLTLASIVEKETGQADERPIIAGVFFNRLQKKMRLQTDPTIIYGIGPAFNGDITYADLRGKTPYNTYVIKGLPPTPIANPSLASLQAVLQPAPTDALYFVAKGDGSHVFSHTLAEHNRAVQTYQLRQQP